MSFLNHETRIARLEAGLKAVQSELSTTRAILAATRETVYGPAVTQAELDEITRLGAEVVAGDVEVQQIMRELGV